jgi:hypothetical protein
VVNRLTLSPVALQGIEPGERVIPPHALEHGLGDVVRGLGLEFERRDDAESAQLDDGAVEVDVAAASCRASPVP